MGVGEFAEKQVFFMIAAVILAGSNLAAGNARAAETPQSGAVMSVKGSVYAADTISGPEVDAEVEEIPVDQESIDEMAPVNAVMSPYPESVRQWSGNIPDEVLSKEVPAADLFYTYELTEIQKGSNDSNPVWSPSGEMVAFERNVMDRKEIIIATSSGKVIRKISYHESSPESGMEFFANSFPGEESYNSGLTWSHDGSRFVFMSNAGTGNYDIYLSDLRGEVIERLTDASQRDGHADWSPVADKLVFVSGQSGKADLYLMDLATRETEKITRGKKTYLYPQWSPDGKKIAMLYGSSENHDIYVIDDMGMPFQSVRPLTTWSYDDLRPTWSPDGQLIAFYTNFNADNDPKVWSIAVVPANGRNIASPEDIEGTIVAANVNPDVERGPAWMPDSKRILYVKNDQRGYYPLYVIDINEKTSTLLETDTTINHDVTCSPDGAIAFRAQVEQWDQIFISRLRD